jgi:hypothetical protein
LNDYKKNKNLPEPRFSLDQLESLAQEEDYYNSEQQLLEEGKDRNLTYGKLPYG